MSSLATSFGGIGSLFYLFGENEDRQLQQVANTTRLVCDRVARIVRGWGEKEREKNNCETCP